MVYTDHCAVRRRLPRIKLSLTQFFAMGPSRALSFILAGSFLSKRNADLVSKQHKWPSFCQPALILKDTTSEIFYGPPLFPSETDLLHIAMGVCEQRGDGGSFHP